MIAKVPKLTLGCDVNTRHKFKNAIYKLEYHDILFGKLKSCSQSVFLRPSLLDNLSVYERAENDVPLCAIDIKLQTAENERRSDQRS